MVSPLNVNFPCYVMQVLIRLISAWIPWIATCLKSWHGDEVSHTDTHTTLDLIILSFCASGFDNVVASIEQAVDLGFKSVKINCVVMRGTNDDQVMNFVAFTKDMPVSVRFIEYMPFDGML